MSDRPPALTLHFLGSVDIRQNDAPVTGFVTQKALALFVYLAVTRQPHTRDHLDTLLWGNLARFGARRALRYALWNLRQILGPFITVTPQNIAFNPSAATASDVEDFLSCALPPTGIAPPTGPDIQNWRSAVELYRGEFLQGLHVRDADEFDAWMLSMRERLHMSVLESLQRLIAYETEKRNYPRGIEYARRLVELEPWNENGHRALIEFYVLNGDSGAARAQYETCRRLLAAELNAQPDSATRELVARLLPEISPLPVTVTSALSPKHNLPTALTPFFGRTAELAQIVEKMREPSCRLLTLTGEGGIGKTRLAFEAAWQLAADFSDGVWFVSLSGIDPTRKKTRDVLAREIAGAVNLPPGRTSALSDQLVDFLRGRQLLLVLDNFEQFLAGAGQAARGKPPQRHTRGEYADGAEWVRDLLSSAPGLRLLVTSRTRLNLQAEYVMRLGGLDVPEQAGDEHARDYSSVRLFLERAERGGVSAEELDLDEIVQFCRMVEGLPLAVELAAARMNQVPLGEMFRALESNLDRMAATHRDVPSQHRSLRAVFENSWRLLSPAEQRVLAQASIFQVGFTREAAERIIDGSEVADAIADSLEKNSVRVSTALDALADKSLLRWVPRTGYFRLHPLIRQFGQEKSRLRQHDELEKRHAFYFLGFAAARTPRLFGPDTRAALEDIQAELTDIRSAWDWCVEHRQTDKLAAALDVLAAFYEFAGLAEEGLSLFEDAQRSLANNARIPHAFRLRLELAYGKLLLRRHRHLEAESLAERVLQEATLLDSAELVAESRYLRGIALSHIPDTQEELAELERARTGAHAAQQTRLEALCLLRLGMVAMRAGEYPAAKHYTRQALAIFETVIDLRYTGACLAMLGLVEYTLGEILEAISSQTRAIEISDQIRDVYLKAVTLHNLGNTFAARGQYDEALACMEQSESSHREVGSVLAIGSQAQKGVLLALEGRWADARNELQDITKVAAPGQTRREYGWANRGLALLARRQGQIADAIRFSRLALKSAQHWDDSIDRAEAGIVLADALFEQGAPEEAEEYYRLVLMLRQKMHQPHLLPEAMAGLAHVALRRGDHASARAWINKIWREEDLRLPPGLDEPFWVYWTGYQVMRALDDPRTERLMQTSRFVLAEYASQITDPLTRDQFLQVPWHRAILQANGTLRSLPLFVVSETTTLAR